MKHSNYRLQCRDRELDLTGQAKIMGIVNITPDSFFDGGSLSTGSRTTDIDRAVEKALDMIEEGADIIDIGGESTKPGAPKVDAEEELHRTLPVIRELRRQSDILISIDTYKAVVAEQALLAGAQIINDISGFSFDPNIATVCSRYRAAAVLMHTAGRPGNMKWSHQTQTANTYILDRVKNGLLGCAQNAERHGICNIILDPGFGFGKSVSENYTLLRHLHDLHVLGRPLLVGLSRKSFLGKALQKDPDQDIPSPEKRLTATIAANTIALTNGANILRVHDIKEATETLAVAASANFS
ncbi:dihydropteroate synthase [Prosthecochloris sp. SCSIO W1101]|uniref:dihydropteroate synthase n=1 Tax=Prosthecochloris sp. SCSIO W1101 TaxID=2992242 RepID=UPI00223CF82B|nr:dihydropteroate synthase [Prosthecochloris sp. SCSIO W1101]UZJ40951.1 dihydropteroate synthase [Prosthecochloris sp. SCSIO W1101]